MELIHQYFPDLSAAQYQQFEQLMPLYMDWNSKINVISRKDMDQFYCNHVLHSLSIAQVVTFEKGQQVLDIGTGGGFPGIPLAILFPETQFTLVDSIGKKIKVVKEVSEALGLQNVRAINDRFENITNPYDFIVSRAVATVSKLLQFTTQALHDDTAYIFIKGGDLTVERQEALATYRNMKWSEYPVSDFFEQDFFETKKVIVLKQ